MTDRDPTATAADAVSRGMRALLARREAELQAGAAPLGWKIGFNTPAIQAHFGLTDAVVGYLLDTGVQPDGATVSLAGWAAPAVEVEVAIRVGEDGEVAGLAPALELVDLGISFDDIEPVLAGNICHRGVIFGDEVPGVDPWAMVASVGRAGAVVAEGRLVEDPAVTAAFVRSYLASHGADLRPGDRIIAGSVVAPIAVAPGDELGVSFGPLGQLSVRFGD
jgi:2-keto-4-pentenoate hydratase